MRQTGLNVALNVQIYISTPSVWVLPCLTSPQIKPIKSWRRRWCHESRWFPADSVNVFSFVETFLKNFFFFYKDCLLLWILWCSWMSVSSYHFHLHDPSWARDYLSQLIWCWGRFSFLFHRITKWTPVRWKVTVQRWGLREHVAAIQMEIGRGVFTLWYLFCMQLAAFAAQNRSKRLFLSRRGPWRSGSLAWFVLPWLRLIQVISRREYGCALTHA